MNQMINLKERLASLDKSIRVAIVGIGSMGRGLAYQLKATRGMIPVAISDININRAIDCATWLQLDYEVVNSLVDLNYTIQRGKVAISENAELLCSSNLIHVLLESTNSAFDGAIHAFKAIKNHQHVVMMNSEADLMYGPLLATAAENEGVVYTCSDGDKPTAIKKLVDEIKLYGFDVVMAGNIKTFQDRYTNPEKIAFEADMRGLDHKMCSYFADGTKANVEMAVLANAINGRTAKPGMMGQRASSINDIFRLYDFDKLWDRKNPMVDYLLGAEPRGGLFVIGHTEDKFQQSTLGWFPPDIGKGPYYLFYKPYYLGHIEAMQTVAEAYLDSTSRLQPAFGMKTNVFTYAKKDLEAGAILDGRGGYHAYGLIENMTSDRDHDGLPILLSDNLKLKRNISKDERITLSDVEFNPDDKAFSLYFNAAGISMVKQQREIEPVLIEQEAR
jgi:predicted homoserine dehydrogenase-like protein